MYEQQSKFRYLDYTGVKTQATVRRPSVSGLGLHAV